MMRPISPIQATQALTSANREPVDDPNKIQFWWRPRPQKYFAFVAEFVSRTTSATNDWLEFMLHTTGGTLGPFKVDVLNDIESAWPTLPSTVLKVKPGDPNRYGVLMLSEDWMNTNQVSMSLAGGPKFPPTGGW